jgi:hypothetical protein
MNWYKPSEVDDFRSNVKIPETTGRIEALMHKINNVNLGWTALPNDDDDTEKAKIVKYIFDYIFHASDLKKYISFWVKDGLIHGSGFARWVYQRKTKKVRLPKTDPKAMAKEEKDMVKEGKVIWGPEEERVVSEGFQLIPISVNEIYVDPNARTLHGNSYEAQYIIWRRFIPLESFKAEFGSNPNYKNVDQVKPITDYERNTEDYTFFQPPTDVVGKNMVEVLEYENQVDDTHCIIANDICIKHSPLPYDHKEITFHKIDCIIHPGQFYAIGIADLLENIQSHQEIILNLMVDKMLRSMNSKYMVAANIYGELTDAYSRADNMFIPVDVSDGQPMNSKVMPLPMEQFNFEGFRMIDSLRQAATMATQVDPSQMNLHASQQTATATAVSKEIVDSMVNQIIVNMSNTFVDIGRQTLTMLRQFWSKKVKKIIGEDGKEKESYPKIRLEGIRILEEEGKIEVEDAKEYSFLEIKPEYLSTAGDLDVRISTDTMEVYSRSYEIKKAQELYAQLIPNAVDPHDTEKMKQHPLPLWNALKLGKYLAKTLNLPDDILLNGEFDEEEDLELAKEEAKKLMRGEVVQGIPGRTDKHLSYQVSVLNAVNARVDELSQQIDTAMQSMQSMIDPMTGQPMPPQPDPMLLQELNKLRTIQQNFAKHLDLDKVSEYIADDLVMAQAVPPAPPMPQQSMMPPQGEMMQQGVPMPGQMQQQDILSMMQ